MIFLLFFHHIADAETENQPAFPNRRPSSKSDRIQPNQYLVPQTMDESMYREQQPPSQQLQWPQLAAAAPKQQTNSIWPEKMGGRKASQFDDKSASRKQKADIEDSEYSDDYADESGRADNSNNEDVPTTTAAPQRKVRLESFICLS